MACPMVTSGLAPVLFLSCTNLATSLSTWENGILLESTHSNTPPDPRRPLDVNVDDGVADQLR